MVEPVVEEARGSRTPGTRSTTFQAYFSTPWRAVLRTIPILKTTSAKATRSSRTSSDEKGMSPSKDGRCPTLYCSGSSTYRTRVSNFLKTLFRDDDNSLLGASQYNERLKERNQSYVKLAKYRPHHPHRRQSTCKIMGFYAVDVTVRTSDYDP